MVKRHCGCAHTICGGNRGCIDQTEDELEEPVIPASVSQKSGY
jgi:hypothetical protein